MKEKETYKPTQQDIEDNLKCVELDLPLTLSLKVLGPRFLKAYRERVGEFDGDALASSLRYDNNKVEKAREEICKRKGATNNKEINKKEVKQ